MASLARLLHHNWYKVKPDFVISFTNKWSQICVAVNLDHYSMGIMRNLSFPTRGDEIGPASGQWADGSIVWAGRLMMFLSPQPGPARTK